MNSRSEVHLHPVDKVPATQEEGELRLARTGFVTHLAEGETAQLGCPIDTLFKERSGRGKALKKRRGRAKNKLVKDESLLCFCL